MKESCVGLDFSLSLSLAVVVSAGSCITSDDRVTRDILYNGNPIQERCTVITRIAPTFIRSSLSLLLHAALFPGASELQFSYL